MVEVADASQPLALVVLEGAEGVGKTTQAIAFLAEAVSSTDAPLVERARAAGAKGASPKDRSAQEIVDAILAGPDSAKPEALLKSALDGRFAGPASRIAHVASIDLARLAQRRPGSRIRFEPIGVEAAQRLWLWRRERLMRLRIAALARLRRAHVLVIGVGGRGGGNLSSISGIPMALPKKGGDKDGAKAPPAPSASDAAENIVALCDVNAQNLDFAAKFHPGAQTFRDFRKLYDTLKASEIDGEAHQVAHQVFVHHNEFPRKYTTSVNI